MVGIVQEQHPDRARLFMQWKEMEWPVLVDAQNRLEVAVVPITLLIDEHGVIRGKASRRRSPEATARAFVEARFDAPETPPATTTTPDLATLEAATADGSAGTWRVYGRALVDRGGDTRIDEAVDAFERAVAADGTDPLTLFQLGVAYRKRFDSVHRQPSDFQRAVVHWSRALELDPNQYIWRRRIQQYGPRQIKPYPFYDWVPAAREAIRQRGKEPVPLVVEPSGAEFAHPADTFTASETTRDEPDPGGRVTRDDRAFIAVDTTVVPPRVTPGQTVRVHLAFRPERGIDAHWNNEAEPMQLWLAAPAGGQVERRWHEVANPDAATSTETRRVELEVQVPEDAAAGSITIPAYALYNVCEGPAGRCLYRRRDIEIEIPVTVAE
jgi:hypothetical protein